MDECKSEQRLCKLAAVVDTIRPPLVPAEKNNAVLTTSHPRTKEVSSSYEAPTPPTSSDPRRFPSPNLTRTSPTPFQVVQKRALSAERKRPSTPPSHQNPSTPVHDSSTSMPISSRRLSANRIPESLWPSTMRSHSVSFQSDDISIPLSQKEKEKSGSNVSLDRTLKPPSNVAHKQQSETSTLSRKPSPERKRNLLEGKNAADQSENAKPVDDLPSRLIDHHRWPSRIGGKLSSNSLTKSVDMGDKIVKNLSTPVPGTLSSLKRMPMSNNLGKPLQKTSGDAARLLSHEEIGRVGSEAILINDKSLRATVPTGILCASSLEKSTVANSGSRSRSPSRTSVSRGISPYPAGPSSPPSRGVSPTPRGVSLPIRTSIPSIISSTPRGVSPTPRVVSPTRMRTSTSSSTSVINSTPRGVSPSPRVRKSASFIEDAHQLRLLYNRYLQWRYANAHSEAVLYIQKVNAEETSYNVWNATLGLWDALIKKRINLQRLKLELKLNSILNDQMGYLKDWVLLERDHIRCLAGAVEDLKATTLHLPVTDGGRADSESLKAAICSVVDVMQAMGSSICSLVPKVEGVNNWVSELAAISAQEQNMLDQCEALLASTADLQLEEYSLRSHLIQTKQPSKKNKQPVLGIKTFPWP
ncbi:tif31 [Gossypium australe]|uniref:Tif31 n=1 Tax=Gossypium australe TaxID=47621 RepID=A0A5B6V4W0_9ROSI|nr:tif31 [Gossypium australe]